MARASGRPILNRNGASFMPASPRPPIRSRFRRPRARSDGVAPGACALLFAGWCGTVYSGASAVGAMAAHVVLVALGAAGGSWSAGTPLPRRREKRRRGAWRDPLELGAAGRWLPPALLVAVALSWWTSPVPRAGRVGLVLLPALLLAPVVSPLAPGGRSGAGGSPPSP